MPKTSMSAGTTMMPPPTPSSPARMPVTTPSTTSPTIDQTVSVKLGVARGDDDEQAHDHGDEEADEAPAQRRLSDTRGSSQVPICAPTTAPAARISAGIHATESCQRVRDDADRRRRDDRRERGAGGEPLVEAEDQHEQRHDDRAAADAEQARQQAGEQADAEAGQDVLRALRFGGVGRFDVGHDAYPAGSGRGAFAAARTAAGSAATMRSSSTSVWAAERNHASKTLGGRLTPWSSIAVKKAA